MSIQTNPAAGSSSSIDAALIRFIGGQQLPNPIARSIERTRSQIHRQERKQKRWVSGGRLAIEERSRGVEISARDRLARECRAPLTVVRIQTDGVPQSGKCIGAAVLLEQIRVQFPEPDGGANRLAPLFENACRRQPSLDVGRIHAAEPDDHLVGANLVPTGTPAVANDDEVGLRVGQQPLFRRQLTELQLRCLVVRSDFEDFLIERGRAGVEAFVDEVLGDARVLPDGFVGLTGARVQVAQRVGGVRVPRLILEDAHVLGNGGIEPALPEQLLSFFQRVFAVEGQGRVSPPGSDARSGLRVEFIKQ